MHVRAVQGRKKVASEVTARPGKPKVDESSPNAFVFGKADKYLVQFSADDPDAKKSFDGYYDMLAKNDKFKAVKPAPALEEKCPANEFESADKDQHTRMRTYLVGKRIYSLMVFGSAKFVKSDNAKTFFDSFSVLPPATETKEEAPKEEVVKEFVSKEAGFKVKAPGKPEEEEGKISFGKAGKFYYVVINSDYKDDKEAKAKVDAYLSSKESKKAPALDTKYAGHEILYMEGDAFYRMRIYNVKKRIYTLTVQGSKEFVSSKEANAFFESFQLCCPTPPTWDSASRRRRCQRRRAVPDAGLAATLAAFPSRAACYFFAVDRDTGHAADELQA